MVNNDVFYRYYVRDYRTGSPSTTGEIILGNHVGFHLHLAVKSMIQPDMRWSSEGIAAYLDLIVVKYNYRQEYIFSFFQNIEEGNESYDIDNSTQVFEHYKNNGGKFESLEDIDMRLYCDASAYINLSTDWGSPMERLAINEISGIPGDELTFIQACSFTAFLVDNYSFDEFLSFCKTRSDYESIFGKTYDELKADWIKYLER